ncbi:MAG: DUF4878 domain-containing protein [Ottowia sp.]|nr:DUF4878 domain-containing protein [Ottowia sp.]
MKEDANACVRCTLRRAARRCLKKSFPITSHMVVFMNNRLHFTLAAAIAGSVAVTALLAGCSKKNAEVEAVALACVQAMVAKDVEYVLSCTNTTMDRGSLKGMLMGMSLGHQLGDGGVKSVEVVDSSVDGNTAKVGIRYRYGNGKFSEDFVPLAKTDGKWKMDLKSGEDAAKATLESIINPVKSLLDLR